MLSKFCSVHIYQNETNTLTYDSCQTFPLAICRGINTCHLQILVTFGPLHISSFYHHRKAFKRWQPCIILLSLFTLAHTYPEIKYYVCALSCTWLLICHFWLSVRAVWVTESTQLDFSIASANSDAVTRKIKDRSNRKKKKSLPSI